MSDPRWGGGWSSREGSGRYFQTGTLSEWLIIVKAAVHDSLYCWVRRVDYDACGLHQEHSNMDAALASDHYYNPRTILIADDSVR